MIFCLHQCEAHELFRREGSYVYLDVPVTFPQLALGTELKVPTLEGLVKLKIPEGTQNGTTFKLKNKGIRSLNGFGKGNQYVTVKLEVPQKLNAKQKEALRSYDGITPRDAHNENKRFWGIKSIPRIINKKTFAR